jgi:hypothetical protein
VVGHIQLVARKRFLITSRSCQLGASSQWMRPLSSKWNSLQPEMYEQATQTGTPMFATGIAPQP